MADNLGCWLGGIDDLAKLLKAESVGALVQSSEAVVLPAKTQVTRSVVCGLCARDMTRGLNRSPDGFP